MGSVNRRRESVLLILFAVVLAVLVSMSLYNIIFGPPFCGVGNVSVTFNPNVTYSEALDLVASHNCPVGGSRNETRVIDNQTEVVLVLETGIPEGEEDMIEELVERFRQDSRVFDAVYVPLLCD